MSDPRKVSTVTVDELVKAFWAGKPAITSPTGSGTGRLVEDVVPPASKEVQGVHYHTALDLIRGFDEQTMREWTNRPVIELAAICASEADVPEEKKLRFYRGGVEWQPTD